MLGTRSVRESLLISLILRMKSPVTIHLFRLLGGTISNGLEIVLRKTVLILKKLKRLTTKFGLIKRDLAILLITRIMGEFLIH